MGTDATQLHQRAVAQCIDGRFAAAQRTLDRAERLTGDRDLLARIAGTRAIALQRTGRPVAAEEVLQNALAQPGLSPHTESILLGQLGGLATYNGRLDDGERWLGDAIDRLSDDPVAASRIRMNRSLVRMQQRRLAEAADDLSAAVSVFAEHGLATDAAQARHNLGYTALLRGDLVRALREMTDARSDAATSPVAEAIGDMDRAEVFRDAGLTTEAEELFRHAAAIFGARRMPQSRAEAEFHLARSLLAHDGAASARVAADAARRFRALGNDAWAARAEAVRLRARLAERRPGSGNQHRPPAPAAAEDVAASLVVHGFRSEAVALRIAVARAAVRAGDPSAPAPRVPASAPMDLRLLSDELKATRAAARGRPTEARRHAAAGLDRLGAWQSSFGSIDLQTSVAMHGASLVFAGLRSAVSSRAPEVVFEWSERARHLSQQVVPLRPPPDPQLADALAELRMLRAENPARDWLSSPRAAQLRDLARERQWTSVGASRIDARVDLATLCDGLTADTALLAYVYTGREIVAVVCDGSHAEIVSLGDGDEVRDLQKGLRADLDVAAAVRTGPMAAVVRRSLDARLAALSTALLDGPLRQTSARRLVVTAPGLLNAIPWAMLPGMRGRVFTLAASASQWLHRREALAPAVAPTVEPAVAPAAPLRAGFAVGPRVARGGEEARVGASAWSGAPVIDGGGATVQAITDLAGEVDVLHVAAHGRHAVDNPMFSGLELADGALFGYDIDQVPRVPATVVLSACEVGRSSVRWGEEAIGMARVWLHAGSATVIAAPVVVADDLACELLGSMHAELARGLPPAEALAAASARLDMVSPFQAHGTGF